VEGETQGIQSPVDVVEAEDDRPTGGKAMKQPLQHSVPLLGPLEVNDSDSGLADLLARGGEKLRDRLSFISIDGFIVGIEVKDSLDHRFPVHSYALKVPGNHGADPPQRARANAMDRPENVSDPKLVGTFTDPLGQPSLPNTGLTSNEDELSCALCASDLTQQLPELLSLALPADERNGPEAEELEAQPLDPAWLLVFIRPPPVERYRDLNQSGPHPLSEVFSGRRSEVFSGRRSEVLSGPRSEVLSGPSHLRRFDLAERENGLELERLVQGRRS
jgi:hypothetical protein